MIIHTKNSEYKLTFDGKNFHAARVGEKGGRHPNVPLGHKFTGATITLGLGQPFQIGNLKTSTVTAIEPG